MVPLITKSRTAGFVFLSRIYPSGKESFSKGLRLRDSVVGAAWILHLGKGAHWGSISKTP